MSASSPQYLESSKYTVSGLRGCHAYVLPRLFEMASPLRPGARILDVGCGNGSVTGEFAKRGFAVTGIDLSEAGVRIAQQTSPEGKFAALPADSEILNRLNERPFDMVYSLEVIEHLYDPRGFLAGCFSAVRPGGLFICSTPYHGYLKNLAISLAGKWDHHADPLFDGGHIKFFSRTTLSKLMAEAGFQDLKFRGAGRLPYLWKSMLFSASRP